MLKKKLLYVVFLVFVLPFLFYFLDADPLQAKAASDIFLDPAKQRYNLNPYIEILEDPSQELGISDVLSSEYAKQFIPHREQSSPSYSYTDSAIWIRFQLDNPAREQRWFLELGYPLLNQIDFYYPQGEGGYAHHRTGNTLPFNTREVEHRNFVFNLPSDWDEGQPFFLRVETQSAMILPLTLWQSDSLMSSTEITYLSLGVYYGIIFIIIGYTLFLFIFSREKDYLYYVIFTSSIGLFLFTYNGLAFQYLWPNHPWWAQNSIIFFLFMGCAAGFLFTSKILPVKKHFRFLDRLLKMTAVFAACMLPFTLVLNFTLAMQLGIATVLFGPLIILPAAIVCWIQKYRPAQFLFWGWLIFALGILLMSFRSLGIMPDSFLTMYGAQLGFFVKVIFLFIGLADHMYNLKKEKEHLSADLQQRMQEIQTAQSAFLYAQIKPHFLFNALNTISYFTHADPGRAKKLIGDLSTYLRQSFDFKKIPSLIPLQDELKLVRAYVNIEKARFSGQLEVEYNIDEQQENRVPPFSIQPLVENAIKHGIRAREDGAGKVTITCKRVETGTRISVEDNGAGIPEETITRIFEKHEESGIGLWNIERRLQNIFGCGLQIQSEPGLGTTVQFYIPNAAGNGAQ